MYFCHIREGISYGSGATAILNGNILTVTSKGQTVRFTITNPAAPAYYVYSDGTDHVLVNDVPTTDSWTAGKSADWGVASNWNAVIVPNAGGNASIAVKGTYTVGIAAGESFAIHNLSMRSATATLDVAGTLSLTGLLTLAYGTIRLDNGGDLVGAVSLAAGSKLAGTGTVAGTVQNAGTIEASGGGVSITGAITGTGGVLMIDTGATLALGAAVAGQTVAFTAGAKGVLKLGSVATASLAITGFATGDVIDLAKLAATSDSYAGGVLTLCNGSTQVASLAIAGTYTGQVFTLSGDGKGSTNIKLASDSAPVVTVPGAQNVTVNTATPIAGISVADKDAVVAGQTITVTVADKTGILSATDPDGGTVAGAGSTKLTITGTLAQIDGDLGTLTYTASTTGSDTMTVGANDGDGGSASRSIGVTIVNAQDTAGRAAAAAQRLSLLIQYMAAFGPGSAVIDDRSGHLAASAHHLDLAISQR